MKKKFNIFLSLLIVMQLILSLATIPVYAESEGAAAYQELESPTVVYNMNMDWKYKRAVDGSVFPLATASAGVAKDGKNFYDVDYDDSDWETVSLPHAVNALDSFDNLGVDAGEKSIYLGFMFYRKHITIPETDAGKKFILEFEAFRQSVYVYINGVMAGYYEAGVAPVGFDLTDYIIPGQDNVIAVATDNAASRGNDNPTRETMAGNEPGDLSGSGFQWNTRDFNEVQGGLTGNVKLHAKTMVYQTLPLYRNMKTMGNYIYGSNFDLRESSADVTVEAEVRNETGIEKDITLQVDIVDKDGNLVATFESDAQAVAAATDTENDQFLTLVPEDAYDLEEGVNSKGDTIKIEKNDVNTDTVEVAKIVATANVKDLKFWSDVSPNLYTVYTYLKDDAGDIIDAQKTVTGFREVIHDPDKGLLINGESTYLKGYAQRSTNEWAAIGVANDWLTDIDMQLVKESNANFIRWMHIAPNPVDIRAGDKYGVISICPAGDKEGDQTGRSWDMRLETMRDVLIYFRNSPSIIFWEAGNNDITAEHMQRMTDLRKELDPSGYRFMGCRTISTEEQVQAAEWVGTMLYRHGTTAYNSMKALGKFMPILETEYHRNESPRRVWDDYSPPYYDYVNKWLGSGASKTDGYDIWDQTQEDFSRTMFNSSDGYSYYYNNRVGGSGKNEYTGAAMMVWSDSDMHVRNCGVENARTSGRVDATRVKKESFYAIQAAQSTTPKIHILGHWNYPSYIEGDTENGNYWYEDKTFNGTFWEPNGTMLQRNPTNKTVYVIGSEGLSRVELYVNDNLVGTDTTPTDNFIYAFDGIDVTQSGKVTAKAYNEREEVVAEHEIKTVGEAATIRLTPVTGPDGLRADGSDIMYVDVEVIDAEGNVCPLDERKINFTVSDESVADFVGGYNSGYYGDGLDGAGERIVNQKDYVFAECGINRVFIRSTREAGEFTLTASSEGMQPVTITLESTDFEVTDGLTTVPQQSFAQGELPDPPPPERAPSLKSLGETFVADKNWGEEGSNVEYVNTDMKDYYTVNVNGTEVEFASLKRSAYKPDSSTGVVGEVVPVLEAILAAGGNFEYTYATEGDIPEAFISEGGELPLVTIKSGENVLYAANGSTVVIKNGENNLTNYEVIVNEDNTSLVAELSAVIGAIDGISFNMDTTSKTFDITVNTGGTETTDVDIAYSTGAVTVTAGSEKLENANLIMAGYDENGTLVKTTVTPVTLEAGAQSDAITVDADILGAFSSKVMLWTSDLSAVEPLCNTLVINDGQEKTVKTASFEMLAMGEAGVVDKVYETDTVIADNKCDAAMDNMVLSEDTSPDGTKYLSNVDYENNSKGVAMPGIGSNSTADILWEADVRFDEAGSGITPYSKDSGKLGTCVRRSDKDGTPKLAIQTSSSGFTNYLDIDDQTWYHIALIGRYSASDAQIDMYVYEYAEDGTKTLKVEAENVNKRNLGANSNSGASQWNVHKGTSVDNVKVTMLGADTLNVTSDAAEITAGNTMQFDYAATRQGQYITSPDVTWSVYNADNTAPLEDASITVTAGGILSVGLEASAQTINVRATAESGLYASKAITINAVDISDVKFDTLTLSADKTYVSATEPLTITASATKGGVPVLLSDSDLIWYATDSTDMIKLGDNLKWIKIENGVVTVDPKAVSQDITIRAADTDDKVRGSIAVHIKSSDALEGNEDGALDRLLFATNGETELANADFVESIDGTRAYKATADYRTGNITTTSSDVVVEMDIRFAEDGAGFQPGHDGKVNTCVIYHDGQLCVQTGGSSFTKYGEIDPEKWYHITIIRKQEAYAHMIFEEYDEDGNRINRKLIKDVNQRNNKAVSYVNINTGTVYDNLRLLSPVPTDITIDTDVKTVFAGETIQATSTLLWNELEMRNPDASLFEYKIYDAEDKYPLESNLITVDATGLVTIDPTADAQDIYVRAVVNQSGEYASTKVTVSASDIFTVNKLLINEETGKHISGISVSKNFFYENEVTFVVEIFDENGALKFTGSREMLGNAVAMGETNIQLNDIPLPDDFDKEKDTIKVYPITKVWVDEAVASDGTLIVKKNSNSVDFNAVPAYDAGSDIAVLVLKAEADETDVKTEDILFFDVVEELTTNSVFTWTQVYDGDYTVKTAGKINGIHKITAEGEMAVD